MKKLPFVIICLFVTGILFGILYVFIPLIASLIDGSPFVLSLIACIAIALLSVLGIQYGKTKLQKVFPLICAIILGISFITLTSRQFRDRSFYKGLIRKYWRDDLVNGFRKTIVFGNSDRIMALYSDKYGNEYIVLEEDHYSSPTDYKLFTIDGVSLGEIDSPEAEGLNLQYKYR